MKGLETMLDNGQKKIKDLQLEVMSNCVNIKKKNFKFYQERQTSFESQLMEKLQLFKN